MATKPTREISGIEWGVAIKPAPGRAVSGDAYLVHVQQDRALLAVVDGLGLGSEAVIAANTAVSILRKYANDTVVSLFNRCHRSLMMSRGAVMTVACLDLNTLTATWLGVGNVEAILLRADPAVVPSVERLQLHGGLVGYQMPILRSRNILVRQNDLLVITSDGIVGDPSADIPRGEPVQKIADYVLQKHYQGNDDALVLVARYVGSAHE